MSRFQRHTSPSHQDPLGLVAARFTVLRSYQVSLFITLLVFLIYVIWSVVYMVNQANDREVVIVKTTPGGPWFVDKRLGPKHDFFQATINSTLGNYTRSCYSRDPNTIDRDFLDCALILADPLKKRYFEEVRNYQKNSLAKNKRTVVRYRNILHQNAIPEEIPEGEGGGVLFSSIIYATEYLITNKEEVPQRRVTISIRWRFMGSKAINDAEDEMLRYNPLALQVVEHSSVYDTITDE